MKNIDVSIIFVNYKTNEMTYNAIKSVKDKTKYIKYEIIVVDNTNDEGFFESLKREINSIDDEIRIINPGSNLGFGNGNNFGATFANGKYLFFLNTDTLLINNAIYELFDFMEKNENCGICGGNLYTNQGSPNASFFYDKSSLKSEIKYLLGPQKYLYRIINKRIDFNYTEKPLEIRGYVSGADLMIRKDLFDKIGGFDKDIFMYYEDNLLCYKAQYENEYKIYNIPSSKIIHYEGGTIKKLSENQVRVSVDGSYVMYSKIYNPDYALKYLKSMHFCYSVLYLFSFLTSKRDKINLFKKALENKIKDIQYA